MNLSEIADRLYALPASEFIAARTDAAKDAGGLAPTVKALRKPSSSAWLINQLARRHAGQLDELFDLGAALRAATERGESNALRELSTRRHRLVRELSDVAAQLSNERVGDSVDREIVSTLEAAIIDERAAAAVRSGRLIRALTATGFEPVDVDTAVAVPDDLPGLPPPRTLRALQAPATRSRPDTARKQADEAAAERAALAKRALVKADAALTKAEANYQHARSQVAAAEAALAGARANLAEATTTRATAKKAREAAARSAR
jgi:hypothetical protein